MGVSATGNGADYSYLGCGPAARLCPARREHRPPGVWYPGIPVIQALLWQSLCDYLAHFQPHTEAPLSQSMCIVCPHQVVYSTLYQSTVKLFHQQSCAERGFRKGMLRVQTGNGGSALRLWGRDGLMVNNYFMHTYALHTKQLTMGSSDGDIFPKQHYKKVLVSWKQPFPKLH